MIIKEYKKKLTIKAIQFEIENLEEAQQFTENCIRLVGGQYKLQTLEGLMNLEHNSYIAKGINGECWAIREDIFNQTYEEV